MKNTTLYLFSSVLLSLFLFYIDEGYYSFHWMKSLGSWIVFGIYTGGIFLGQWLIDKLVSDRYSVTRKRIVSLFLGIPIGLIVLFLVFSESIGK